MFRFSISEFSTYRWSLEQEVTELTRRGISRIGIWRTKYSDLDSDYAADILYRNNISVSSLSWAGGFTGTCGPSHEDAIEDGKQAIRTAAKIGADCLILHSGARGGHTKTHCRRLFTQAVDRLLPHASDYGVSLAVEIMNRDSQDSWTVFENHAEALAFVSRYKPEELGIVLDLFHVGQDSEIHNNLKHWMNRIRLIQVSDRRTTPDGGVCRCRPGAGVIPIQAWYNALEESGYLGCYEFEIFGPHLGAHRYRQLLDDTVTCFRQLKSHHSTTTH